MTSKKLPGSSEIDNRTLPETPCCSGKPQTAPMWRFSRPGAVELTLPNALEGTFPPPAPMPERAFLAYFSRKNYC